MPPMRTAWTTSASLLPLAALLIGRTAWAEPDARRANDLRAWDVTCYCTARGSTPDGIIGLDDNGEILLAARGGTTRAQLSSSGVRFTESQLRLLADWDLLRDDGGKLTTAIALLSRSDAEALRAELAQVARALAPELRAPVAAVQRQLHAVHRDRSAFTILFSYVLDGLVWRDLEREKLLAPFEPLTPEHPFWSGSVWAIESRRAFRPGTNSFGSGGVTLNVNWSGAALPRMGPLRSARQLDALVRQLAKGSRIADAEVVKAFAPYGVVDAGGAVTVPVLSERAGDPLYDAARGLAAAVAASVRAHVPLDAIQARYRLRDRQETLVIAYHELMWELVERLRADGLISIPTVLASPADARPSDFGDVVFVVRGT